MSLKPIIAAGVLLSASGVFAQNTVVFDHFDSGFQFSYPPTWKLKKQRDHYRFTIPFEDVKREATLDVFAVTFPGDIPMWQAVQTNVAKDMKHEVVRQWQEEILTVPLLMARTKWTEKDVDWNADSALVYASTRRRLVFRLEARADDFERANTEFRAALQTLRTIDGKLPTPWDPSKPFQEDLTKPEGAGKSGVWTRPRTTPGAPVKGELTAESMAGAAPVIVRYGGAWKISSTEAGLKAESPEVGGPVMLRAHSSLESEPPGKALLKASSSSLQGFSKVTKREETPSLTNKAGSAYAYVWREGTSTGGALYTLDAAIASGDFYVVLQWQTSDAKEAKKLRERVVALIDTISIEPKPAGGN